MDHCPWMLLRANVLIIVASRPMKYAPDGADKMRYYFLAQWKKSLYSNLVKSI